MRSARRSLEISNSVRCLWREPRATRGFSTAVSLHGHTMHSREGLDFIPRVLRRVGPAHAMLQRLEEQHIRETGKPIPFGRAFWRPPLHPHAAYDLEAGQIDNLLGLLPMVSLTDHDNLDACAELDAIGVKIPYSVEWTVPYEGTVFHIGVHNLPAEQARASEAAMRQVTSSPEPARIAGLLGDLHALPDTLLILNHPFSCEALMDRVSHVQRLIRFLDQFGVYLHALELNGLQPKANNMDTIRLASERGLPVISGGDRHCCEPNANLNLTNARSFTEFVHEIRRDRHSNVLFLPQYRDSIPVRYIEFIWHAVRTYPDLVGRERWVDRVFYQREGGEIVSCGSVWPNGGPMPVRAFISVIGFLASPGMRAMLCMATGRTAELEPETL